ncbi:MAG: nucleotidyltransferase family protein [Acidobacteriota bacterium]
MTESRIGGILLAAGGSSRMGEPKQFLIFDGKTLLGRAAEALTASGASPIVVVTGSDHKRVVSELEGLAVHLKSNDDWGSGMGSSLKAGLARLLEIEPLIDAVVVTLCDQPLVTHQSIERLCSEYASSKSPIVASEYAETIGVPALFSSETFSALSEISNEKGARDLIRSGAFSVSVVPMPEAADDLDTPDDYKFFKT